MFRENTDHLIGTFSEALKIMDHNATLYMIDEMQKEIDEKTQKLDEQKQELDEQKQELDEKRRSWTDKKSFLWIKIRSWKARMNCLPITKNLLQSMRLFCGRTELHFNKYKTKASETDVFPKFFACLEKNKK